MRQRRILLPQQQPQCRGLAALSPAIQARLQSMTERHAQILDAITNQSTTASDTSSSPEQLGKELSSLSEAASLHGELASARRGRDAPTGICWTIPSCGPSAAPNCGVWHETASVSKRASRTPCWRCGGRGTLLNDTEDDNADADAIIEVRAGTGGEEAGLFANELLNSYVKTARALRWKAEILSQAKTDLGGIREASVLVSGRNVELELPAAATTTDVDNDIDTTIPTTTQTTTTSQSR